VENFGRALMAKKAIEDVAELVGEQLKAFADANGGSVPLGGGKVYRPVWGKGKAGIDKEKLTADGLLEKYTKRGEPFPTYRITNAKDAKPAKAPRPRRRTDAQDGLFTGPFTSTGDTAMDPGGEDEEGAR
jgi:hypothetical protein